MQIGVATLENSMEVPQKVKIELPYNPAIALLGILKGYKNTHSKVYMHPDVYSSIIENGQTMERAQVLTD